MEKKPRVFFPILSNRFNTSGAAKFGQLVFLIKTENFSPLNADACLMILKRELARSGFSPDVDYFGATAPQLFLMYCFGLLARRFQKIKTLMFDATTGSYVERTVDLGGACDGE